MKTRLLAILAFGLIASLFLVWRTTGGPENTARDRTDVVAPAGGHKEGVRVDLVPGVLAASDTSGRQIAKDKEAEEGRLEGQTLFGDGTPSSAGLVAAWKVGIEPSLSDYWAAATAEGDSASMRVWVSTIRDDGTFSLAVPQQGGPFVLGAVSFGAVSRSMEEPVVAGTEGIRLTMDHLYGVVIRVQDSRGGPVRTSQGLFGDGPSIKGSGGKSLQQIPRMLALLDIRGLDVERQSRDHWTYLLISEKRVERIGPIEYRIDVPGYEPEEATLFAEPVDDCIAERTVLVRVKAEAWGVLVVRTLVGEGVLSLCLEPEENVGSVVLFDENKAVMSFALHARGFLSDEAIDGVPSGRYSAYFEAKEGYYRSADVVLEVGPGHSTLELDLQSAGALSLHVDGENGAYNGRLITSIVGPQGGIFHTNWEHGPYCLPLLETGAFHFKTVLVPGRTVELGEDAKFRIEPGNGSTYRLGCSSVITR